MHAPSVISKLEDGNWEVRRAAFELLGKLDPVVLGTHAAAVIDKLEDLIFEVRSAAQTTLGKLDLAEAATHAPAVITKREHEDSKGATFIMSGPFKIMSIGRDLAP